MCIFFVCLFCFVLFSCLFLAIICGGVAKATDFIRSSVGGLDKLVKKAWWKHK